MTDDIRGPVRFDELEEAFDALEAMHRRATVDAPTDGSKEAWEIAAAIKRAMYDLSAAMGYAARREAERR